MRIVKTQYAIYNAVRRKEKVERKYDTGYRGAGKIWGKSAPRLSQGKEGTERVSGSSGFDCL